MAIYLTLTVVLSKRLSAGVIDFGFEAGMHEDNLGGGYGGRDACPGVSIHKWSGALTQSRVVLNDGLA